MREPNRDIYTVRYRACSRWAGGPSAPPFITQSVPLMHFSAFGKSLTFDFQVSLQVKTLRNVHRFLQGQGGSLGSSAHLRHGKAWKQAAGCAHRASLTGGEVDIVDIVVKNCPTQIVPEGREALRSTLAPLSPFKDPLLFCRKQTLFGLEAHLQCNLISIGLWLM